MTIKCWVGNGWLLGGGCLVLTGCIDGWTDSLVVDRGTDGWVDRQVDGDRIRGGGMGRGMDGWQICGA
jgi:hypothetical protein